MMRLPQGVRVRGDEISARTARAVDQDVDLAERLDRGLVEALHRLGRAYVEPPGHRPDAAPRDLGARALQLVVAQQIDALAVDDVVALTLRQRADGDIGAGLGKRQRDGAPHSRRAAGDPRGASVQVPIRHAMPSPLSIDLRSS